MNRAILFPHSLVDEVRVAMIARRAAHGSVAAAAVTVVAALWAFVSWGSGSPGPALVVSMIGCVVGFVSALVAVYAGSERRVLKVGLVGLLVNGLIAAFWAATIVLIALGSS